jgi:hypothetical protein
MTPVSRAATHASHRTPGMRIGYAQTFLPGSYLARRSAEARGVKRDCIRRRLAVFREAYRRTLTARRVSGDMRRHTHGTPVAHPVTRVVAFVGGHRDALSAAQVRKRYLSTILFTYSSGACHGRGIELPKGSLASCGNRATTFSVAPPLRGLSLRRTLPRWQPSP